MTSRADERLSLAERIRAVADEIHPYCQEDLGPDELWNRLWGKLRGIANDLDAKLSAPTGGMPDAPIQSVVDTLLHQVRNRLDFDRSVLINVLQDIAPLRAFDKAKLANKLSVPAGMPDRPRRFCADTVGNMHIDAHGGYVSVDDYETLCTFAQARAEECERLKEFVHLAFVRREVVGFQSWKSAGMCSLELTFKDGAQITTEYDDESKWQQVISLIEEDITP